jgi:hypothetical protein
LTDRHKRKPISYRPSASADTFLREHSAATGKPLRAIIAEAVERLRASLSATPEKPSASDPAVPPDTH